MAEDDTSQKNMEKPANTRQKAVAIKQSAPSTDLPRITAVGHGHQAEKILKIAFENDVKVRQDEDLVNILAAFDVDSLIPLEALQAVSEILYYVYKANGQTPPPSTHRTPPA